ncbi:MAG: response regulator [Nitrososphaeraceae archaeon]
MSGDKPMHERKILLVDNEPDVTYAIESVLEDNGFEVDSFNDPVLASAKYKQNYYDLLLLDIKMPKMDGFELYESIREKDKITKICFLTASEMFYESLRKARNLFGDTLGEEYFIQKPAKSDQLVRQLNDIINSPQKQPST